MATAFTPLTDNERQSTVDIYSSPQGLTPLDEVKNVEKTKTPLNPAFVPSQFVQLENNLAQEGSSTSTLSNVLAWVAAAKGDFRGLTAIEEAKRRTALGKAIVPHIRKYNELANEGKLDEASQYLDTISSSFGARAQELVPYLTQMAGQLNERRKQVQSNTSRYEMLDSVVPKDHPYRPVIDALGRLAKSGKYISGDDLRQTLQHAAPHVQTFGTQTVTVEPLSGAMQSTPVPQLSTAASTDDFVGNTVASMNNITTPQLADVLNGRTITDTAGNVIAPGSAAAKKITKNFTDLQAIKPELELAKMIPLDPTKTFQAIKAVGRFKTAMKDFSAGETDTIETGVMDWLTKTKEAEIRATVESDPLATTKAGLVTIGLDPTSSHYLREIPPAALGDIQRSGGRIGTVRREVLDKEIKQSQYGLESLDLLPVLLEGNTPETRGDRVAGGINRIVSARIGYPLTKEVEVRQAAKSILNTAIEQVENAQVSHLQGKDRTDIADLKKFAAGDFKTNDELLKAADYIRTRLNQIIERAIGGMQTATPRQATPTTGEQPVVTDTQGRPKVGRQPIIDTKMKVPQELKDVVREYERTQGLPPGSTTSEDPTVTTPPMLTPQSTPQQAPAKPGVIPGTLRGRPR
jgi:hypothetical protein